MIPIVPSTEMLYIFQQETSNTTSEIQLLNFTDNKAVVTVWGTWDGATLTLEVGTIPTLDSAITWMVINDRLNIPFEFTENNHITLTEFVNGQPIRGIITNAGASTVLNCVIQVI